MNFHSPEAANVAAWRERAEFLEEENRLLREALQGRPTDRVLAYRKVFNSTPTEGKILDALIDAKGEVISRHQIALKLYGLAAAPRDGEGDPHVIDILLTKLRHKLRAINGSLEIKNCWAYGWSIAPTHRSVILALVGETTPMTQLPPNSN